MNSSDQDPLFNSLQELKEACLSKVARLLISPKISDSEVMVLARTMPLSSAVAALQRRYLPEYLWRKFRRAVRYRR